MATTTAEPWDVRRVHRELYAPPRELALVRVPPLDVIVVDGEGDPNTAPAYAGAVQALFTLAYALRFQDRAEGRDGRVGPLEALWRAADPRAFTRREKDAWAWTALLTLPAGTTDEALERARASAAARKPLVALDRPRRRTLDEGLCVHVLHVGPYNEEGPVLARLHEEFLPAHGLTFAGDHHEVYLNDPRRTRPERLRTVLRQPVRPLDAGLTDR